MDFLQVVRHSLHRFTRHYFWSTEVYIWSIFTQQVIHLQSHKKNWLQFFQTKSKHIQRSTQSWRALYSFDYHAPGQDWSWLHKMYKHMRIEQVLHSQTTCNQFRFHIQIVLISASFNVHIVLRENSSYNSYSFWWNSSLT